MRGEYGASPGVERSVPPETLPRMRHSGIDRSPGASLVLLAALTGVFAAPLVAQSTWIVPAVARTPGANGARWTTGLTMWNGGPAAVSLSVRFTPHDTDGRNGPERTLTILARRRRRARRRSRGAVPRRGLGALRVTSNGLLGVLAQTSTPGASGTYGQKRSQWARRARARRRAGHDRRCFRRRSRAHEPRARERRTHARRRGGGALLEGRRSSGSSRVVPRRSA
jgi:hypothetical protein